ncbi:MAG: aspartyl protease family protein [Gammaproteobacteria bacterium]
MASSDARDLSGDAPHVERFRRDLVHAAALFSTGRFSEAENLYHELVQLQPERWEIITRLGHLALLGNRLEEAIEHLAKALNGNPRSHSTWNLLALAYYRKGELGSAAYCYHRLQRRQLASTLAAMADCRPYRSNAESGGFMVELSWMVSEPLPVVLVHVNGQRVNLVIDTAAGDLVLDEAFAVAAGVRFGGREQRRFAGGRSAVVWYGHAQQLDLGRLSVYDLPVQVMPLAPVFAPFFATFPIHGVLGSAILSQFVTTLDYHACVLRLVRLPSRQSGSTSKEKSEADVHRQEVPFWIAGRHCLVACGGPLGMPHGPVLLDTGMSGAAFAMPRSMATALGLNPPSITALEIGYGGGGGVEGQRLQMEEVCLGGFCRRDLAGIVLREFPLELQFGFRIGGLIAHEFFRGCRLILDFGTMHLSLVEVKPSR